MASVALPSWPGPMTVAWQMVDFGGTLQGPLGGAAQRVNRLGNRWRCMVAMPALTAKQAREWSAALTQGLRLGVTWEIVQPDLTVGSPGSPLVNGADQIGHTIDADGLTPGWPWQQGQMLSVIVAGRRYVHQLSAAGRVDGSGEAELPIEPALRVTPANNGTIELAKPVIEGLLEEPAGWAFDVDRLVRGFNFSIAESR